MNEFSTLRLEFSKFPLSEVYEVQQAGASEMQLRENVVSYQETKQQKKAKARKALLKEKEQELQGCLNLLAEREQEILVREQNHLTLAETIKSAIAEFPPEASQEDEDSTAKVNKLVKIVQDICKQVEELQAR